MHNNNTIVPYISLCSGYEGIGLGLHRCIPNLRCIAYCEREAFAIANLVAKMEKGLLDEAPVFTDVTAFPWEQFTPYMAGGILSFGWPCQPVSMAGKRKATEDERWLFDIIADGISILKPRMLFAENVEGLLSAKMPDGSSVFGHCIERLERLHYKVEAGIFSASEVGAPHQRKRVFILAVSSSLGGAAGLSRSLAWNERFAGVSDNGGSEGCGHVANDTGKRLSLSYGQRNEPEGQRDAELKCCGHNSWPSRPGEPQHGWEPPRTIGKMENGSWLGRQISSQQSRKNAVQGERGLERDDLNNQGHGIFECELEARRKTEKSNDPHSGCDAVSWGKAKWIGDKSHGWEQVEQLRLESGICDSSREQPPCSNDGPKLHERRIQSNGEAQYRPSRGDTTINGIAVSNSEEDECMPTNHIVDSFWKKVEGFEARVMADTNNARWKAGRNNSIPDGRRSGSHRTTSHCSNQAGAMEDTICSGGEESEYQQANLPAESSGCDSEGMGYTQSRENNGRESRDMDEASSQRGCCDNAADCTSEVLGNSKSRWTRECGNKDSQREGLGSTWPGSGGDMGNTKQLLFPATGEHGAMDKESRIPTDGEGSEPTQADSEPSATRKRESERSNASEFGEIECSLGGDAYESSVGLGISELSGLSDSELAEIREWMVKTDNRTDELRLLGNGVVKATATRAFLTLLEKLK